MPAEKASAIGEIEQYKALRQEISQRTQIQHAYTLFNLAATGGILAFSLTRTDQTRLATAAPLLVPFISLMLLLLWLHHAFAIIEIGLYLEHDLHDAWEERHAFSNVTGALFGLGQGMCFLGAPILALAILRADTSTPGWPWIHYAALATLPVIVLCLLWWLVSYLRIPWVRGRFRREGV